MTINPSPAPVVLFVYKRAQHTRATLAALAKNVLAAETNLYVFCDGPKGFHDADDVIATRAVVRKARGFKSITIIEREKNWGLANSVINGVSQMFDQFDRLIVLEDDLVTSRHFLMFMNLTLNHYCNDSNVFSVTGHTFPEAMLTIPEQYNWDTYIGYRCSSWSWGTWRDRWEKIDWRMNYFHKFINDQRAQVEFNLGGVDLTSMLSMQYQKKIDSWAIRFSYAHYANASRCVYPIKTLVRNIGLDNSGTHTRFDRRFLHLFLDDEWLPQNFCTTEHMDEAITNNFREIFSMPEVSVLQRFKRKLGRIASNGCGLIATALDYFLQPKFKQNAATDVLFVNTHQFSGGAARAAFRCFAGIRAHYHYASYLSLLSDQSVSCFYGLKKNTLVGKIAAKLGFLDRLQLLLYPKRKRGIFSPAFWANPCRMRLADFSAKLVHLHWVTGGMIDVAELPKLDVPIVWTLHDQWPFTGGCHYANDCDRYMQQCGSCPALTSEQDDDISNDLWLRKLDAYSKSNITIVAPSRWMANIAQRSSLLVNKRIEVIPNGLDTNLFYPRNQEQCRSVLGINNNAPVLLFGAHLVSDNRKGGDLLAAALQAIDFSCTLLVFGEGVIDVEGNPYVAVHRLGSIDDDAKLAQMYCAADVFICPSRIDNLPNTIAEAMSCGVPCVAFNVGGISEMIDHLTNGWLARPFDADDLLAGVKWVVQHHSYAMLSAAARDKALTEYSLTAMGKNYKRLYEELLATE